MPTSLFCGNSRLLITDLRLAIDGQTDAKWL